MGTTSMAMAARFLVEPKSNSIAKVRGLRKQITVFAYKSNELQLVINNLSYDICDGIFAPDEV